MLFRWWKALIAPFLLEPPKPDSEWGNTYSFGYQGLSAVGPDAAQGPSNAANWKSVPSPPEIEKEEWRAWVQELVQAEDSKPRIIRRSLSLAKLRITWLPANLTVHGDLDLRQCQRLRRLGSGLVVNGQLSIGGRASERFWYEPELASMGIELSREGEPPLRELPLGMRVLGGLRLLRCHHIERLPEDIHLKGNLVLQGCRSLASLPDPLVVHGDLHIQGCESLTRLPEDLRVTGDVRLIGLPITQLPDRISIGGSLVIDHCHALPRLPDGLSIVKHLCVRHTPIQELPPDLRVGSHMNLKGCHAIATIPNTIRANSISFYQCNSLASIPAGLCVGSRLSILRCAAFHSLPEELHVPERLELCRCVNLVALPNQMNIGSKNDAGNGKWIHAWRTVLDITGCTGLECLPRNLKISGSTEVADTNLKFIEESPYRRSLRWRSVEIPTEMLTDPESLTPFSIVRQQNTEVRRLMLERMGIGIFLEKSFAITVDADRDRGGERQLVAVKIGSQPVSQQRFLRCRCPSTGREYLLRVPFDIETCHAAAAWLAGFQNPNDYAPIVET